MFITSYVSSLFVAFLVGCSFGIADLSVIVAKICKHVGSNVFCCCVPVKDNIGECSRGSLPGVLDNSYLGTTIFHLSVKRSGIGRVVVV